MYIRQECFLPFEELIKYQPETKIQLVLAQLDFNSLAEKLCKPAGKRGPKGHEPLPILYSLISMQVEKISTVAALVARLQSDPIFRYNCGFDLRKLPPSEATFSRFIDKLSSCKELENEFKSLVLKAKKLGIINGTNIAIDATKLDAFEKAVPQSKTKNDGKSPNWGNKKGTDGNKVRWFGYKLHILADCKSELPLNIIVSPASDSDGIYAIPLIEDFKESYGSIFSPKYFIMDSGYDFVDNYNYIINKTSGQAIIAYNKRGSYAPPEGLNENLHPICSMGYELTYWGKDGDYLKFRCPHAVSKVDCPQGTNWCSNSSYGYCLKINYKKNHRFFSYPIRGSEKWQLIYNKRTSIERCNSRLKEYLNVDNIRSAGIAKAKTWSLLNCIALIAGTISVNVASNLSTAV